MWLWVLIVQFCIFQNFFKPHYSSPIHYEIYLFLIWINSTDLLSGCMVLFWKNFNTSPHYSWNYSISVSGLVAPGSPFWRAILPFSPGFFYHFYAPVLPLKNIISADVVYMVSWYMQRLLAGYKRKLQN